MKISKAGLDLIKEFEGFVPYVYDDLRAPVNGKYREWKGEAVKGTLTIGIGHTAAARHPMKPTLGLRVTEDQALEVLDVDLDECEDDVNRLVKAPLTQGQFDALVSFTFNCGAGNLKKLIVPLNKGDYLGTRAKFDLYVKSKGKTLRGLQRRRDAEQVLWDADVQVEEATEQGVDHPAEVEAVAEPMGAGTAGSTGAAVGAVSGAAAATSAIPPPPPQVTETITNAGVWKGLGETVAMFGTFAWQRPVIVCGIAATVLFLTLGPRFLPEKWRPS